MEGWEVLDLLFSSRMFSHVIKDPQIMMLWVIIKKKKWQQEIHLDMVRMDSFPEQFLSSSSRLLTLKEHSIF